MVIFDGLDEIFDPEQRETITKQIVGFSSDYPKTRIIVTSRVIGYRRKILTDEGFTHFTLQDLDERQITDFVNKWYALALSERPNDAKERRERIMRSFNESPSMRQLAGNPMLLTIMAIIGKHQELPRERWKLYDHAASVLIQHWDVNKFLRDRRVDADLIGEEDKKELLRRLAFKMQSGARGLAGNYIHREQLQVEFEGYLKSRYHQTPGEAKRVAEAMIDQFRERNFILSLYGANLYGFVHRAFLEYFCAATFVWQFEKTKGMDLKELKEDVYGAHWTDQSWHEVLRLICGMIDEKFAEEIINYLASHTYIPLSNELKSSVLGSRSPWNIVLAVQCLSEVRNLNVLTQTAKGLLQFICLFIDRKMELEWEPLPPNETDRFFEEEIVRAVELIGTNWPERTILTDWLRERKTFGGAWLAAFPFGKFVGSVGAGLNEVHQAILDYGTFIDRNYRVLAPFTLAIGWRDDPKTLPLLRQMAVNDSDEKVREAATHAIGRYFPDAPKNH